MKYTQEEVIEKFGEIELSFEDYYKYSFGFNYKNEILDIHGSFGGDSNDIYRYNVSFDKKVRIKDFAIELNYLRIIENGEIVFEYSDY